MLNWFSRNYSWIFSGIGVLALVGAALLYRKVRNRRPAVDTDALRDESLNLALGRGQVVESNLAVGSNISQIVNVTKNIGAARPPVRKRHPAGPTPLARGIRVPTKVAAVPKERSDAALFRFTE
jgi:hypothetical protein